MSNPCAQLCTLSAGNYSCSCNSGFVLDADRVSCNDVDECATSPPCDSATETCENNEGSYT